MCFKDGNVDIGNKKVMLDPHTLLKVLVLPQVSGTEPSCAPALL